jgi:hypothetical protein
MYIEKTKTNKYKFIETYTDYFGNRKKVSVTLEKNTRQSQNQAYEILQKKIKKSIDIFNVEYNFLDCFYKYMEYKKNTVKPTTYRTYNVIYNQIINNSQNWKLSEIKAKHLLSIFNENERNLPHKIIILKDFIKWCYKKDFIDDINFLQKIDTPKWKVKEKEKLYLEKKETEDVLQFFSNYELIYMIIKILLNTGLRVGELFALNYSDLTESSLSINKTEYRGVIYNSTKTKKSTRIIEINQEVIQTLKQLKQRQINSKILAFNNDRIFVGVNKMSYTNFVKYLNLYKSIHLHPHIFRHTHASLLIEKGISVEAVSRRLGHEDTIITKKIYIHLTEKLKEKEDRIFREIVI